MESMAWTEKEEKMMDPYHNRIKQRIRNGELIGYEFVEEHPKFGECLMLHFGTYPPLRPVRSYRYSEYVDILVDWKRDRRQQHEESGME